MVNFVPEGSSNSRTTLLGGDERRKALFRPFRVSKKQKGFFGKSVLTNFVTDCGFSFAVQTLRN